MTTPLFLAEQEKDILNKHLNINSSLSQLKSKCKELGINNSKEYRDRYKDHGLPAHPERIYRDQWISYRDFFDIKEFIPYHDLVELIKEMHFKNQKEYKSFVLSADDDTIPLTPHEVYKDEWVNWYVFLGNPEPCKPDFIKEPYRAWAYRISEFMRTARSGGSKETILCKFVKEYIIPFDGSESPEDFLMKERFDVKPFKGIIDKITAESTKRRYIVFVNEFLDYIINNFLTIEDEDTGEIIRLGNARNPFALLLTQQNYLSAPPRSETTKPYLQFHFVKKIQSWIIPDGAKDFRDLVHLQKFDADWVKVDKEHIDINDKDCVYKTVGRQTYLWLPIDWMHTYTLTKVPLRGRQIAYNDSGEADEYIADIIDNKVTWLKNKSSNAGLTKSQAFIKKMPDGQLGMYVTTNKTNNHGAGYSIPWMPEDLAYWLIKLRKWQQKYNPFNKPAAWIDCRRTNLNEPQRKAKGINSFLFRRFNDFEPASVSNALTPRLAAAIYYIQPSNLVLSSLSGNAAILNNYKSRYTPHSMRVSLITAYVIEMGMPIEIIMKIVGHSSVVMTIYYCKISNNEIKRRLEEGEKVALKSEVESIQKTIEQNKIEDVKNRLVSSNEEILRSLTNEVPAGNYMFRDYGICPYAASRCEDGGPQSASDKIYHPVPHGYLGIQNCIQCRHFITGPAFLGGLLAVSNEILLESNDQSDICHGFESDIIKTESDLSTLEREEYIANKLMQPFDKKEERSKLEVNLRNQESQYESAAKKLDMLLCDLQSSYSHIRRCHELINGLPNNDGQLALITTDKAELVVELEEVSHYQQLQEVCNNAVIYRSCSADKAIYPRTQILDKMAIFNNIIPQLFTLSKEQQLRAGNQIFKLFMSRLKSWEKIQKVVDCQIKLNDLNESEKITKSDIELILTTTVHMLEHQA